MHNTILENLKSTLSDLQKELTTTTDPAKRQDLRNLIVRFQTAVEQAGERYTNTSYD